VSLVVPLPMSTHGCDSTVASERQRLRSMSPQTFLRRLPASESTSPGPMAPHFVGWRTSPGIQRRGCGSSFLVADLWADRRRVSSVRRQRKQYAQIIQSSRPRINGYLRISQEQPTRLRTLWGASPQPSIAQFGRLAYPMHVKVTTHVLLGRKSHSRQADTEPRWWGQSVWRANLEA
jgi:hypothetical protein